MTKILLVEDDKSLREIYGVRLLAEGYDIVSAGDGEEALAVAIREKPDLIISDVMMPKISGFEMLDLLRGNETTKNIKVIMMTALSSDQQRERGEKLGADRYLVKSQVGIEDVVRTVHDVLGDRNPGAVPATPTPQQPVAPSIPAPNQSPINPLAATRPSSVAGVPAPTLPPRPMSVPPITAPTPATAPIAPQTPVPVAPTPQQPVAAAPTLAPTAPTPATAPIAPPVQQPAQPPAPAAAPAPNLPPIAPPADQNTSSFQTNMTENVNAMPVAPVVDLTQSTGGVARVIQPTGDTLSPKIDINNLLAKEDTTDMGLNPSDIASTNPPSFNTSPQLDEADVAAQLDAANAKVPPVSDNNTVVFPSQQQ